MSDKQLKDTIALGADIQKFLPGKIGEYLMARAHHERDKALLGIMNANPTDSTGMAKLQVEAKAADAFIRWLHDAVKAGEQAEWEWESRKAGQTVY